MVECGGEKLILEKVKISLDWLSDFVKIDAKVNEEELVWRLTEGTAEIEHVQKMGEGLEGVVVGVVRKSAKHPDADKLTVNEVEVEDGKMLPVVCGAPNMREGIKVILAKVGARVRWHGEGELVTLEKTKIRGEVSEGMACAVEEVGLEGVVAQKDGEIAELETEAEAGTPLAEALGLNDTVLEIDNHAITHRADLFSQRGVAREVVGLGMGEWVEREVPEVEGKGELPFKLVLGEGVMSNYAGVVVKGVANSPAPEWMRRRLLACGVRPLGALVDVTNYVMLELGMPMHAFDLRVLEGNDFNFRLSKEGEKVVTLDGVERELPEGIIVADDGEEIVDLCGIMGGEKSGVKDDTGEIFLHAPVYDKVLIRKGMVALKHRTDAGTIYEKGVDPALAREGLERAVQLLKEVFPEVEVGSGVVEMECELGDPEAVEVGKEFLEGVLGMEVGDEDVVRLEPLGFLVESGEDGWRVSPPSWRREVTIQEDVAEEVARMRGLNNIPEELPKVQMHAPERQVMLELKKNLAERMVGFGFDEVVGFSLVGRELLRRARVEVGENELIEVENAVSDDFRFFRPNMLPRMLEMLERNVHVGASGVKIFEIGRVAREEGGEPREEEKMVVVWYEEGAEGAFFEIKGVVEELVDGLGVPLGLTELSEGQVPEFIHPTRQCVWADGSRSVCEAAELHPVVGEEFDARGRVGVAVLDLDVMAELWDRDHTLVEELPKFPGVKRDVAAVFGEEVRVGEVLEKMKASSELLVKVELFDVYRDEKLKEAGRKSLAFRLEYRDAGKTLTEAEVEGEHARVLEVVKVCGGEVRG